MSVPEEHRRGAPSELRYSVFVVSTSRYVNKGKEDVTGQLASEIIEGAGNIVVRKEIIPDDIEIIRKALLKASEDSDVILFCGGTGVSRSDVTPEALRPMFSKELPGFGEVFRWLSYSQVGSSAIASRASAGVCLNALVFLLPGSPDAVKLALERIIIPEAPHLIAVLRSG